MLALGSDRSGKPVCTVWQTMLVCVYIGCIMNVCVCMIWIIICCHRPTTVIATSWTTEPAAPCASFNALSQQPTQKSVLHHHGEVLMLSFEKSLRRHGTTQSEAKALNTTLSPIHWRPDSHPACRKTHTNCFAPASCCSWDVKVPPGWVT